MYYIYKITNKVNKKSYIGFTHDLVERWNNHKNCKKYRPLYNAITKHGIENFSFSVLYEHENREHVLLEKEPHFIELYDTYNKGYNCTKGGENTNTEEMRKKLSIRMKTQNPMKVMRINSGSFKKGQKPVITKERNEKIRKSKIGKNNPMFGNKNAAQHMNVEMICEHCQKTISKGNYYRWHGKNCKSLLND